MWDSLLAFIGLPRWKSIEVSLNPANNPPVILSREEYVTHRRVKWTRADSSFEFLPKSMNDLDTGKFPSPLVKPHLITCRNRYKTGDKSEYTIYVTTDGTDEFSSTIVPPGGNGNGGGEKPVIRN